MDQRKARQARYVAASVEKTLGALPVVADYCRRLDLAGIIDHAAPIRELADLTHGQVIETLIANRLTSPAPLVRVSDWARESSVSTPTSSTTIGSGGHWTRSHPNWTTSSDPWARRRSRRSGSMCPVFTGT